MTPRKCASIRPHTHEFDDADVAVVSGLEGSDDGGGSQIDADPLGLFPTLGALERTNSNDDSDADSSDSDCKGRHRWGNKEEEARKRERAEKRKECCGP